MRLLPTLSISVGALGLLLLARGAGLPRVHASATPSDRSSLPEYTSAGNLRAPANYREWVFLTSGFDMAYQERATGVPEHAVFDNVFVNPEAYQAFLSTGTWPDKTVIVLETRTARSKGETLVKTGRFQDSEITGLEVHLKDASRFHRPGPEGTWGFFAVQNGIGKVFEPTASCYTCHHEHAAVDTTFVQFYPTLLPVAETRGTISAGYRNDQQPTPAQPQ